MKIIIALFITLASFNIYAEERFECTYSCHIGCQTRDHGPFKKVLYYSTNTLTMSSESEYIDIKNLDEVEVIKGDPKRQSEIEKFLNEKVIAKCNANLRRQSKKLPNEIKMSYDNIVFAFPARVGDYYKNRKCYEPESNIESPDIENDVSSYFCSSTPLMLIVPESDLNYDKENYFSYSRPLSIGRKCLDSMFNDASKVKSARQAKD